MALDPATEHVYSGEVRDNDGRLIVVTSGGAAISGGGGGGGSNGTINAPADAVSPTLAQQTQGFLSGWNGTNWDRLRASIANGLVVDVSRIQGTVTVTGTVAVSGTVATTLSGTPAVSVSNFPASQAVTVTSGAITATISGTPAVTVSSGTITSTDVGNVAHAAADSGNPLKTGGVAKTADITAVADAQRVNSTYDILGKQLVLPYGLPGLTVSGRANLTTTTSTAIIAAGAAGIRNYVTTIVIVNASATVSTKVSILDGVTVLMTVYAVLGGGGVSVTLPVPLRGTAATAINAQCATTGADVEVTCVGYRAAA